MDPETSSQISYIRLIDTLSSGEHNDLISRIENKDWTVFDDLYEIYPQLTSTGDKDLEEDTRNLAYHDIYNLARFHFRIVPEDHSDIPRIIRMVISSIEVPEDTSAIEKELHGLTEISKFSQSSSIMDVDMSKIAQVDWTEKPYRYPVEFCLNLLYSDAESMLKQFSDAIGNIDFDSIMNLLPEDSGEDSDSNSE